MTTVAVMQPYFYPYTGYYSLAEAADVLVLLDDVQFPRRGYVHRNRLRGRDGVLRWLTLPLERAPREARIEQMRVRPDAGRVLERERPRFPALARLPADHPLQRLVFEPLSRDLVEVLEAQLRHAFDTLGIGVEIRRASHAALPRDLPAEERILRLVEWAQGTRYVNAPGGRALYDPPRFAARGIELRFLLPFHGDPASVLDRLIREGPDPVREDVLSHVERSGLPPNARPA